MSCTSWKGQLRQLLHREQAAATAAEFAQTLTKSLALLLAEAIEGLGKLLG